eukprot:SAG25_NODE_6484_length_555_cov_1.921053_1_plen_157_part_10
MTIRNVGKLGRCTSCCTQCRLVRQTGTTTPPCGRFSKTSNRSRRCRRSCKASTGSNFCYSTSTARSRTSAAGLAMCSKRSDKKPVSTITAMAGYCPPTRGPPHSRGTTINCTHLIRTTISPDTSRPNSCHERTVRWNSLRLSGYASLALIRHWTIFL